MIGIICDSIVDLPLELAEREDVYIVPVMVVLGEKSFREGVEISKAEIADFLDDNFARTSLPSPGDVMKAFETMYARGYDELLVVNLSGGLSGTHNLFKTIGEQFASERKSVVIESVDSLSLSGGIAMLVYKAIKMTERGDSLRGIASDLRSCAGIKNIVFFTLPTLKYLKQSGRIGRLEGSVGEILNVKPIGTIDSSGVFTLSGKARGMKKAVEKMVDRLLVTVKGKKVLCVALYHSGDDSNTVSLVDWVRTKISSLSENLLAGELSSGILVHGGKGIIGVGALIA
jgi:DegV family protein with EDD domain